MPRPQRHCGENQLHLFHAGCRDDRNELIGMNDRQNFLASRDRRHSKASVCASRVWSDKKHLEKLDYMHANPVKRGLVGSADQWPWSSFRFYYLEDSSLLAMNHLP